MKVELLNDGPAAPAAPQGAIPAGTVIGEGKLKIVLARIDTRLLHGQVATPSEQTIMRSGLVIFVHVVAT